MAEYDVIIVGAGLGGLSAGARLSQAGKKVLLVEQHNVVGGCSTEFKRKRTMRFEVGLHEFNGANSKTKRKMFEDLAVWDRIEFVRVPEFYRVIRDSLDIVMPDNIEDAISSLNKAFPKEETAIRKYFEDIISIRKGSELIKKYYNTTVGEYMDNLTKDEDLKLALIANLGYYHDDPYSLAFIFFASAQASYTGEGGWFIKGGSQNLSNALADVITENGGEIILKHLVTEIIIDNNTAVGIKFIRRKRTDATLQEVYGDIIIVNASILSVVNELIPSLKGSKTNKNFNNLIPGCSLFSIYYSFKKSVSKFVDNRYSTFIYSKELTKISKLKEIEETDDYNKKGFVFVNYDAIDSGMCTENSFTGTICGIDYLKNWEDLEKSEYKKKKQRVIDIFTRRLNEQFPGIEEYIDYSEMSTPKTIKRYTLNPYGTVYGFAQTPKQLMMNKSMLFDPPISNLYFASAWISYGGFSSAINSGYSTANKILN